MKFKHYKGGEYEFVCLAFFDPGAGVDPERAIETMVVYKSLSDGTTWVRPAPQFFALITGHYVIVPRFSPLVPPKQKE